MCCGGAPKAPDPVATAQAQSGINKDALLTATKLNQITQNNPFGSLSYSGSYGQDLTADQIAAMKQSGQTDDQINAVVNGNRTQNVSLNPQSQGILNQQLGITTGLDNHALARLTQIPDTPFSTDNAPGVRAANLQTSFDPGGAIQTQLANTGQQATTFANVGGPQRALTGQNYDQQIQNASDAAYNAQTQYVDSDYDRQNQKLDANLAAKGITEGTQAWNDAHAQVDQSKQQTLQGARNSAVLQGQNIQGQLYGQNLSSSQFANSAQDQAFQQAAKRGDFGNAAQQASFQQSLASGEFNNAAVGQQFSQNQDLANFYNNASTQQQQADQSNRSQNIAEDQLTRNQGFNELASFLNASPISPSNPTFQPFSQSTAAQAAPNSVGVANNNYTTAASARASILGSIFGAVGNLGSGAAAACWVAREVYGIENPKWLLFRTWLLTKAPKWFRNLYIRHGHSFAQWLKGKERLKSLIRYWMDARIA